LRGPFSDEEGKRKRCERIGREKEEEGRKIGRRDCRGRVKGGEKRESHVLQFYHLSLNIYIGFPMTIPEIGWTSNTDQCLRRT